MFVIFSNTRSVGLAWEQGLFFGNFLCCGKNHKNEGGLARHQYAKHAAVVNRPTGPLIRRRKAYSVRFRASAVELAITRNAVTCAWCEEFKHDPLEGEILPPQCYRCACGYTEARSRCQTKKEVAFELGVHPSMLGRWLQNASVFQELVKEKGNLRRFSHSKAKFPAQEDELYMRFVFRKKRLGLPIDSYWLRSEMLDILNEEQPRGYWSSKLSKGWLYGFLLRYDISHQCKNDKKSMSIPARLPQISMYHRSFWEMQGQMCDWTGVSDPVFGAFKPSNIWNADQCPLPFALSLKRSYNLKGHRNWIAVVGADGLDKRQATLHPCLRADGEQVMDLFIIFRNPNNFKPTQEEIDALNACPNIKWAFQKNAWADSQYSLAWLKYFVKCLKAHGIDGKHLLLLDDWSPHKTAKFREFCLENGILPWMIPAGCTDVCQPVDLGMGGVLKSVMAAFYKIQLEVDIDEWRNYKDTGALAARNRRIMMARWASKAWGLIREMYLKSINKAFRRGGALVHRDRSNGASVSGIPNYNAWDYATR